MDTTTLSEQLQKQIQAEKLSKRLNDEARAKFAAEDKAKADAAAAAKEEREAKRTAEVEAEIKARYLATGASEADWNRERGRLLGLYREEVVAGRVLTADDQARAQFHRESRAAW